MTLINGKGYAILKFIMRIHKGDMVQMTVGKDAGKQGKIIRVRPDAMKVLVEGLNMMKRHRKPKKQGEKGEIIAAPRFVNVANVMLICPKCGKTGRIGYMVAGGKKIRICKKCASEIS